MKSLLHRHSTLFGLGGAAFVVLLAGLTTRWNAVVMLIVGLTAVWFLPHLAYGRAESDKLDAIKSPFWPFPIIGRSGPTEIVDEAYTGLQGGFDSEGRPVDLGVLRKTVDDEQ
jgi:uncharacterized membrane protein YuzA (DUF378 family)